MAITLDCPRCKKPLSVPSKKIGRYANCPRCGGRFWVPDSAGAEGGEASPAADGSSPAATPPPAQPPQRPGKSPATVSMGGAATVPPGGVVPTGPSVQNTLASQDAATPPAVKGGSSAGWQVVAGSASAAGQPPPTQPTELPQKTARFVSAEAARSTLKLEDDGKLPELHLHEAEQKEKKQGKATTVNPVVLFALLAISVALSIWLALMEAGPSEDPEKARARDVIERNFFPREGEKPLEYQESLMLAQRAHIRGDREAERRAYQRVLELLRQERPVYVERGKRDWSLTKDDELLEEQISVLLGSH